MITAADLIASAKKLNRVMRADNKAGNQWRYYNTKRSASTFKATRAAKKFYTNCMGGVSFVAKNAGISGDALDFYGGKGNIVWLGDGAKARTKKVFDILAVNRPVKQAVKKGIIQPGDILTYKNIIHTNMFIGNNKSFDSGHAYCDGNGEGAPFLKWIGSLAHPESVCKYVLRLKGPNVYRVQVGAYDSLDNAGRRAVEVARISGLKCFMEHTDMIRVYCGSFEQAQNAIERIHDLENANIKDAFIVVK